MARLLVIDDEALVRQMVRLMLEPDGHTILESGSGADGLALLTQNDVDLVLTDMIMPGIDGIETIQKIRRLYPALKIIAMSGASAQGLYLDAAAKLGADAILHLPFTQSQLRVTIAHLLA